MSNKLLAGIISVLILSSCASSYRPINTKVMRYGSKNVTDGVELQYKYDILLETGNKKYARKANNNNIRIVAVHITNNSDQPVEIGDNFQFSGVNGIINQMEPTAITQVVKQSGALYLLYAPLTLLQLYTVTPDGYVDKTYNVGLTLGPAVVFGNMIVASTANKKFMEDLLVNDVYGKVIEPGEEIYGIIGFRSPDFDELKLNNEKVITESN